MMQAHTVIYAAPVFGSWPLTCDIPPRYLNVGEDATVLNISQRPSRLCLPSDGISVGEDATDLNVGCRGICHRLCIRQRFVASEKVGLFHPFGFPFLSLRSPHLLLF